MKSEHVFLPRIPRSDAEFNLSEFLPVFGRNCPIPVLFNEVISNSAPIQVFKLFANFVRRTHDSISDGTLVSGLYLDHAIFCCYVYPTNLMT